MNTGCFLAFYIKTNNNGQEKLNSMIGSNHLVSSGGQSLKRLVTAQQRGSGYYYAIYKLTTLRWGCKDIVL